MTDSVTLLRDATAPVVTYSGNLGSYNMTDTIAITCAATDATSGVASDTCADITGSAQSFGPGVQTFSATATDNAGNVGSGTTSFTVGATHDQLCALTQTAVRQASVARTACAMLAMAEQAAASGNVFFERIGLLNYELQIRSAMSRRYVSRADGQMLLEWAGTL